MWSKTFVFQSFADSSLDTASISGHLNETNVDKAIKVITESDGSSLLYGNVINFLAAQVWPSTFKPSS